MMYTIIVILVVLAAVLMCAIVFIQESKGGGLASGFASGNSMLGVRKTTDVVEKTTWSLAAIMVVLSVASVFFLNSGNQANTRQSVTELQAGAAKEAATNAANQAAVPSTPAVVETPAAEAEAEAPAEAAPAEAAAE